MNALPAGSDTAKKVVLAAFAVIFLAPLARGQNHSPMISPGATSRVVRSRRLISNPDAIDFMPQ